VPGLRPSPGTDQRLRGPEERESMRYGPPLDSHRRAGGARLPPRQVSLRSPCTGSVGADHRKQLDCVDANSELITIRGRAACTVAPALPRAAFECHRMERDAMAQLRSLRSVVHVRDPNPAASVWSSRNDDSIDAFAGMIPAEDGVHRRSPGHEPNGRSGCISPRSTAGTNSQAW